MAQPAYALPMFTEPEAPNYCSSLTQPIAPLNLLHGLGIGGGSISITTTVPQNPYRLGRRAASSALASVYGEIGSIYTCLDVTACEISISTSCGPARSAIPAKQKEAGPPVLMSELKQISKLKKNWDGEGAEKPSVKTIKATRGLLELARETVRARREHIMLSRALWSRLTSPLPDLNVSANQQLVSMARALSEAAPGAGLTINGETQITSQSEEPSESDAALYATVDGAVTLKWTYRGRELKCTITDDSVEVIRWKSDASYESDGLWDLPVEQTREHFEWLMR